MELITNALSKENHKAIIKKAIIDCKKSFYCFMPFISESGFNFLSNCFNRRIYKNNNIDIKFITCDSPQAYRSGSLKVEFLLKLKEIYNAEVAGFGDGLHAKLILIDGYLAIITSANLTRGGLESNMEFGIKTTDKNIIEQLNKEFKNAWSAAEQLSTEDLKKRIDWVNNCEPIEDTTFPAFRKKVGWQPVYTSGVGTQWGIDLFDGFKKEDFSFLDPRSYGGAIDDSPPNQEIVDKIKAAIGNQITSVLRRFYLGIKDYLPTNAALHPHYANRKRVKNFYPSATWLGLGRNPKKYVTLAQLSVGLFVDPVGEGIFTNFNIGEEYQVNEDKPYFLNWLKNNLDIFLEKVSELNPNYYLEYNHPEKGNISIPINNLHKNILIDIINISHEFLLDLNLARKYFYEENINLLTTKSIVFEVAEQFKILYPIYINAFR